MQETIINEVLPTIFKELESSENFMGWDDPIPLDVLVGIAKDGKFKVVVYPLQSDYSQFIKFSTFRKSIDRNEWCKSPRSVSSSIHHEFKDEHIAIDLRDNMNDVIERTRIRSIYDWVLTTFTPKCNC